VGTRLRGAMRNNHTVLPATRHRWTCPALTQPGRPVLNFPTPEGWKAELTLILFIYRYGLPVRRQSLILVVTQLGVKPTTTPYRYATKPCISFLHLGEVMSYVYERRIEMLVTVFAGAMLLRMRVMPAYVVCPSVRLSVTLIYGVCWSYRLSYKLPRN